MTITPELLRDLDEIKVKLESEIKEILNQLKKALHVEYSKKIKDSPSVKEWKALFSSLTELELIPCTIENIILDKRYMQLGNFAEKLKNGETYWQIANKLSDKRTVLQDSVEESYKEILTEIKNLKFKCFESSFKFALESYAIQQNVIERRGCLDKLSNDLIAKIQYLMADAKVEIFDEDQFPALIKGLALDSSEMILLNKLIDDNVQDPFTIDLQEKGRIVVSCKGGKISLKQVLKKIKQQKGFKGKRMLCIKGMRQKTRYCNTEGLDRKILYFDRDLIGDVIKNITIEIGIEVLQACTINLGGSSLCPHSFILEGAIEKGGVKYADNEDLLLIPDEGGRPGLSYSWWKYG